jgi:lysophospholipid acyltransferase (LPLAT)-like uncharacterized protein
MPHTSPRGVDLTAPNYSLDAVSLAILAIGTILGSTWRIKLQGPDGIDPFNDTGKRLIYCFWHSHILPLTWHFRNTGKIAVVSESKDGIRAAAVAQRWGHRIISGSSSRGGSSVLRKAVGALSRGENLCITPDGPRGPREQVKAGTAEIALLAGASVIAVKACPHACWRLRSWDRFMIPKPFTRITIRLSPPLHSSSFTNQDRRVESFTESIQGALSQ